MTDHFHAANRRRWDAGSASWAHHADTRGIWERCHRDPSLALHSAELKWLGDVAGKSVAVLGSGDNQVVFALSGLGAKVTSAHKEIAADRLTGRGFHGRQLEAAKQECRLRQTFQQGSAQWCGHAVRCRKEIDRRTTVGQRSPVGVGSTIECRKARCPLVDRLLAGEPPPERRRRLEYYRPAGADRNRDPGLRISAGSRSLVPNRERPERGQLHGLGAVEAVSDLLEHELHQPSRLGP
jgi:hypothetical protein